MAQNNDGPGKRLKREQAKNTLYVDNPNDKRLQAYKDSSKLYNAGLDLARKVEDYENNLGYNWGFYGRQKKYGETGNPEWPYTDKATFTFFNPNKPTFKRPTDPNRVTGGSIIEKNFLKPDKYNEKILPIGMNGFDGQTAIARSTGNLVFPLYKKPERPVVLVNRTKSEPIEPMASRQAPVPSITPSEMVAPVMRPVAVPVAPPMEEPMMEEQAITERPVARKPPRAVMPRRAGGWSNQPLLMQLFPKLYER